VCALVAGSAAAQTQGRRPVADVLTMDDSTACLHRDVVVRDISKWLGRDGVDERVGIVVRSDRDALRFVIRRGDVIVGERVFPTAEVPCAEADATLAAAIASAIDAAERAPRDPAPDAPPAAPDAPPAEPTERSEPEPDPPVTPSPPKKPPPAPASPPEPESAETSSPDYPDTISDPSDKPDHRIALAAQGTVLLGVLPFPAPGVVPAFEVTLTRIFELRASGLFTASQEHEVRRIGSSSAVVAAVDIALAGGRVDACAGFPIGRGKNRVRGCVGLVVASVRTSPVRGAATEETATPWVAPALRAEVEIPAVEVFGVGVAADFFVPVVRPELVVERGPDGADSGVSEPLSPVGGGISLGPFLHF
jgi:hypothetical protein